jgi:hypothetical protein
MNFAQWRERVREFLGEVSRELRSVADAIVSHMQPARRAGTYLEDPVVLNHSQDRPPAYTVASSDPVSWSSASRGLDSSQERLAELARRLHERLQSREEEPAGGWSHGNETPAESAN